MNKYYGVKINNDEKGKSVYITDFVTGDVKKLNSKKSEETLEDLLRIDSNFEAMTKEEILSCVFRYGGMNAKHFIEDRTFDLILSNRWISVDEILPDKLGFDWVLIKIVDKENPDFGSLPYIAELRNGVWYSNEFDKPIEEVLDMQVVYWKPIADEFSDELHLDNITIESGDK